MSANTALELEDVVFRYQEKGKRNILDHTSLSIPAGTLTVLMGGSGCGKSTLATVAAGLYPGKRWFSGGRNHPAVRAGPENAGPAETGRLPDGAVPEPGPAVLYDTLREEMRFCLENIRVPAGEMDAPDRPSRPRSWALRAAGSDSFHPVRRREAESGPFLPLRYGEPLHPAG